MLAYSTSGRYFRQNVRLGASSGVMVFEVGFNLEKVYQLLSHAQASRVCYAIPSLAILVWL